jgi:hypothetical protein
MAEQPAGVPEFTADMLCAAAEGVLRQWLDSYTDPTDEEHEAGHPQRRMRVGTAELVYGQSGVAMPVQVTGEGEPEQEYQVTVIVQQTRPEPRFWRLEGYDTFSGESYQLGTLGPPVEVYLPRYSTYGAALADAVRRLAELERLQPSASSGGQTGIQDQVRIVHPDGHRERVHG